MSLILSSSVINNLEHRLRFRSIYPMLLSTIFASAFAITAILAAPIPSNEIYGRSVGLLEDLSPVAKRQDIGEHGLKKRARTAPATRPQTKQAPASRAGTTRAPSNQSPAARKQPVLTKTTTISRGTRAPAPGGAGGIAGGGQAATSAGSAGSTGDQMMAQMQAVAKQENQSQLQKVQTSLQNVSQATSDTVKKVGEEIKKLAG